MFKIFNIFYISFLVITFHLLYLANINNTNLNMKLFMLSTVILLIGTAVWAIILIMKFIGMDEVERQFDCSSFLTMNSF